VAQKVFEVCVYWSTEGNDWCAVNDELPVAAEAPTLDELFAEVKTQAAEMAELNGLAEKGEEIEVRLIETLRVRAAA
jgi:predicted RNase H-like HicB family nuclease